MSYAERISSRLLITSFVLILSALSSALEAQTCTVPDSHATIQHAINDPACTMISLSAQPFAESIIIPRSMTLTGPGAGEAIVEGLVLMTGAGTEIVLHDLIVRNGCSPNALRTVSGAKVSGNNLSVERSAALPCPAPTAGRIFADGFESGGTSNWSMTLP